MDIVNIDGKEYDPYFILGVGKTDSNDHIKRFFREKVKKYHPDKYTDPRKKEKYEKYFKILNESYQYIKRKRDGVEMKRIDKYKNDKLKNDKSKNDRQEKVMTKGELEEFNSKFKNCDKQDDNNYVRIGDVKDYKNFSVDVYNQFKGKKFSNKIFNNIFEHNKVQNEENNDEYIEKSLIHKTTDGFKGYNSSDFGNCALVSSFNGLMIAGDYLGDLGSGYWGNGYSDYKYSYKTAKNPNSKIIIPKDSSGNMKNSSSKKVNIIEKNEKQDLDDFIYEELVKKEQQDEMLVKRYIDQYDTQTVQKALTGELDASQTYKSVLKRHFIK